MKLIGLTGKRFGMLVVTGFSRRVRLPYGSYACWSCLCDCGKGKEARGESLRAGCVNSCGCLAGVRHGQTETPEYKIWTGILNRCRNPRNRAYSRYGGKGVKVSDQWGSFPRFIADMGPRPSPRHSVDRYPNPSGNYEHGNCRWATYSEQRINQSRNPIIEHDGRRMTLKEWAAVVPIKYGTLSSRLGYGWDASRILTTPPRKLSGVNC